MNKDEDIGKNLSRAIRLYYKYRSPESKAKLLKIVNDVVYVEFRRPFCETCGINVWVEDLKYVLEDLGIKTELVKIIKPKEPLENYRIGIFKLLTD